MTSLSEELQQRAGSLVESAYEAGADAAREEAFNAGYESGHRDGFQEALDIVETTRQAFEDGPINFEDDECDCEFCQPQQTPDPEIELTGDYAIDVQRLANGLTLMGENDDLLQEQVDAINETLDTWAPNLRKMANVVNGLRNTVAQELGLIEELALAGLELSRNVQALEEQSLADDLMIETLNERLRVVEEFLGFNEDTPIIELGEAAMYSRTLA